MSAYSVTRAGQELGSFELPQIQEGLKTAYFQPTDWCWKEGMSDWQPLSAIAASATGPMAAAVLPAPNAVAAPKAKAVASPQSVGRKTTGGALNPYAAPTSNAASSSGLLGTVPTPVIAELSGTKPWVRFLSVLMWIVCILMLLFVAGNLVMSSIAAKALADSGNGAVGAGLMLGMTIGYGISAMLIIYPTLKLSKYASNIGRLTETQSFADLISALREQRRFWKFYGILMLIYISLILLFVLLMVAGVGIGSMAAQRP